MAKCINTTIYQRGGGGRSDHLIGEMPKGGCV